MILNYIEVINRLKEFIKNKHISQNEFARRAGISSSLMSQILVDNKNFGIDKLVGIINGFPDLDLNWLLKEKTKPTINYTNREMLLVKPFIYKTSYEIYNKKKELIADDEVLKNFTVNMIFEENLIVNYSEEGIHTSRGSYKFYLAENSKSINQLKDVKYVFNSQLNTSSSLTYETNSFLYRVSSNSKDLKILFLTYINNMPKKYKDSIYRTFLSLNELVRYDFKNEIDPVFYANYYNSNIEITLFIKAKHSLVESLFLNFSFLANLPYTKRLSIIKLFIKKDSDKKTIKESLYDLFLNKTYKYKCQKMILNKTESILKITTFVSN